MAKYIIDIEDEHAIDWVIGTPMCKELCIPFSIPNRQRTYHVVTGIKLEPYTEPDRKVIEDEVWSLARKIAYCMSLDECKDAGMLCYEDIYKSATGVLEKLSYREAKVRYEAWTKQKAEIHVGDEVKFLPFAKVGVVVGEDDAPLIDDKLFNVVWEDGTTGYHYKEKELFKTGRHFNEV